MEATFILCHNLNQGHDSDVCSSLFFFFLLTSSKAQPINHPPPPPPLNPKLNHRLINSLYMYLTGSLFVSPARTLDPQQ